ncbi:hypothetical protein QBC32DRAFT_152378 [Pseudoneurospora amorphoporcata]|uniref:Uncharacterized protein n=1 Tax=Pseudoneurospora amorphoporcata TaxID=241081 RepID=A0AAN6NXX2_9PEZI|nr:hypothetical protein QBC32DRAFT_152378 [Pseudoneurospora amorphoporcata]
MTSPSLSRKEAESQVRSWGFSHVFTWTDGADAHYAPHKHSSLTTHLILSGSLTIAYPGSEDNKAKTTHGPGETLDVDAGLVHEVWIGREGCTYVIGE